MVSSVAKDVIGGLGGAILSFCLVPQLWKMYCTRSAADLSMPFIVLYTLGECTPCALNPGNHPLLLPPPSALEVAPHSACSGPGYALAECAVCALNPGDLNWGNTPIRALLHCRETLTRLRRFPQELGSRSDS